MHQPQIMFVEDERVVAMMLRLMLSHLGYEVCAEAASGEDALDMLPNVAPDLILMDVGLDGRMDGVETASRILEVYPVPIVFTTSYTDEATRERMMAVGPAAILTKPFAVEELRKALSGLLPPNLMRHCG